MEKLRLWEDAVNKLQKKVEKELSSASWRFKQGIKDGELPETNDKDWELKKSPANWSMKNGSAYFRRAFTMPGEIEGIQLQNSNIYLTFLIPSGVELFINGEKTYEHKYWADKITNPFLLMRKAKKGERRLIVFKTPGGDGLGCFGAKLIAETVEDILFELNAILYQVRFAFTIAGDNKKRRKIAEEALRLLNPADIENRDWEKISKSIKEAEEKLEVLREDAKQFKVHLLGHAHIDMNWLWTYDDTVNICLRDFETVNKLMEKYPGLTFSQSQAHTYKIIEENDEKLFEKVQKRIQQGRWEVTATSWVENDINMADGESILRQILYANNYAVEKLGPPTDIFWAPDTFGHPSTTPSILGNAGIKYYYFMRCGKGPPLFRWKGEDGKELLAFNSVYNNKIAPETMLPELIKFYCSSGIRDFLFVYGVGDHGGGPTEADIKRKKMLEQKPAVPSLEFSTAKKFFKAAEKHKKKLPVIRGEMNTIFEGCYTTHCDIKRLNRECEALMFSLETLAATAGLQGVGHPEKEMTEMWRKVLFNQFHDILDGSSIHAAYDYSAGLAEEVKEKASFLLKKLMRQLKTGKNPGQNVIVFNPLGWNRTSPVSVDAGKMGKISFIADNIKEYGYKTFSTTEPGKSSSGRITNPAPDEYENDFYRIRIDGKTGLIRALHDKKQKREVLSPCTAIAEDPSSWQAEKAGNLLSVSWEKPHPMSSWIIGNIYRQDNLIDAEKIEANQDSLGTNFSIKRKYMESDILQKIILYKDFPFIDFQNEISWNQQGDSKAGVPMLRVNFNVAITNPEAYFEIPFGAVRRTTVPREQPALRWAGLNSGNYWIALMNRFKHGYYIDGSNLSLTLLRNPYEPDAVPDSGYHNISYRLFFGKHDVLRVTKAAWEYNYPPIVVPGNSAPKAFYPIKIKGDVLATSFKKAFGRNSYILRLLEISGNKQSAELEFRKPFKKAYFVDAAERRKNRIKDTGKNKIKLRMAPSQIVGLDIEF